METMPSSGTATVTLPTDEQILITREFDAPKHLVYRAWTTPELVKRWWSGQRGEMTVVEIDLRVGGAWRYVLAAKAASTSPSTASSARSCPNERIVTTEVFEMPDADPLPPEDEPLNIVTFTEVDGRTTLDAPRADHEQGAARHDRQLRHGSRHAGAVSTSSSSSWCRSADGRRLSRRPGAPSCSRAAGARTRSAARRAR